MFVSPVPLPVKYWFAFIVNASTLLVNILMTSADGLYIPDDELKLMFAYIRKRFPNVRITGAEDYGL